ncbi:hypothetical protein ACHAQJ_001852 [Trichoderma viride]
MASTLKSGSPTQKASRSPASHHSRSPASHHSRSPASHHSRSHRRHRSRRSSNSLSLKSESPRIVLGHGAIARLPTELNKLSLSFPLIICSPSRLSLANRIRSLVPNLDAYIIDSDTHPGSAILSGRDSVISVGGPRAVAMARRISLKMTIPHVCVPTTHSGAAGHLSPWRKQNMSHDSLSNLDEEESHVRGHGKKTRLPTVIIYDEKLTESRIRRFSAPSGILVGADVDVDSETDINVAAALVPRAVDKADVDAFVWSTAQWSYIHLPGV